MQDRADLEELLVAGLAASRAAWEGVAIEPRTFLEFLAERCPAGALPPVERVADLYLVCGCALGDPVAIGAFDRAFRPLVAQVVGRMQRSPAFADDVFQHMCEKLLVGSRDRPPRITEYAGRASLRSWLTTIAKRTALNLQRNKDEQPAETDRSGVLEAGLAALGGRDGPDAVLLKARFKEVFEAAIRAALARIPDKDRSLLLMHLVDGVTVRQLAVMQNTPKTTVARWIDAARDALAEQTRRELHERANLTESEYESLAALVRSQLDVSLASVVKSPFG